MAAHRSWRVGRPCILAVWQRGSPDPQQPPSLLSCSLHLRPSPCSLQPPRAHTAGASTVRPAACASNHAKPSSSARPSAAPRPRPPERDPAANARSQRSHKSFVGRAKAGFRDGCTSQCRKIRIVLVRWRAGGRGLRSVARRWTPESSMQRRDAEFIWLVI